MKKKKTGWTGMKTRWNNKYGDWEKGRKGRKLDVNYEKNRKKGILKKKKKQLKLTQYLSCYSSFWCFLF